MSRKSRYPWLLGSLALLMGARALAQQGSKVHMHGDEGYAADGFLYEPANPGGGGAVLIIHGAAGLSAYVREEAHRLSALGFVAVAIDLYRGGSPGRKESSGPTGVDPFSVDAMRDPRAASRDVVESLHDLKAALTFLRSQPNVRAQAIGVEGWAQGASYALRLARTDAGIRAVAVTLAKATDAAELGELHRPLLVNLPRTTNSHLSSFHKEAGADIKIYSQAQGAFFDPESAADFRPRDADDARQRMEIFLVRELAENHPPRGSGPHAP